MPQGCYPVQPKGSRREGKVIGDRTTVSSKGSSIKPQSKNNLNEVTKIIK